VAPSESVVEQAPAGYRRAEERDGPLPVSTKIFQAFGTLPEAFKLLAFGTFLLFYYNQVLGMRASTASLAISIALIIDAVTDPLVGSYSDSLQTRLGRRHPLMYASILPLALFLALTFMPPAGLGEAGLFIWLCVFAVATRVAMTFFLVPWTALFAELSDDYVERTSIVTYRVVIGWIGGTAFTFLVWTHVFPSTAEYTPGHLDPSAYRVFAVVLFLSVAVTAFLATHLTRHEVPYMLQPAGTPEPFSIPRVVTEIRLALGNRNFAILFMAVLIAYIVYGAKSALTIYINTYFWGLGPAELRWFGFAFVGTLVAFAIMAPIQKRFDKKQIYLTAVALSIVESVVLIALRLIGVMPENGHPILLPLLVAGYTLLIVLWSVITIVAVSMIGDVLDANEARTGLRQEGMFSAALTFSSKASAGIGVVLGGLILDHAIAFPRGADPASVAHELIFRLGLIAGIALPLLYFVPFALMTRYRLSRTEHAAIQSELAKRRSEPDTG
jgi:Na+/melibiose symporter-like transporter